jgi:tetratricopeptide (TPR) repeat protein
VKTCLSIAVAVALTSTVAAGEPIPEKAKSLAQQGRAFHDKGDYPRAVAAFKEAYVIAPSPALLFNLAQAYRLQGNCEDAAMMYRRYLGTYPPPDGKALAEGHLETVDRCVSKRGLNIQMDESAAYLNVRNPPQDLGVVDAPPSSQQRDNSSSGTLKKRIGIGFAIGGGIAIVGATYYGIRAYSAGQEVERLSAEGAKAKDIQAADERGTSSARNAKILGITGAIAATTGVALYIIGVRDERANAFTIVPTTTGAAASYAWRF